jgi:tellurite resistance protein
MLSPILLNAARAFAMVSFADGNLAPAEAQRFAKLAGEDPTLTVFGHADVADAWAQASKEVHAAQSFGTALLAIRTEIVSQPDRALMMRIAQAAAIADGKLEAQENKAIQSLAEALGLNPDKY